jgi:hypothetical protein
LENKIGNQQRNKSKSPGANKHLKFPQFILCVFLNPKKVLKTRNKYNKKSMMYKVKNDEKLDSIIFSI